MRDRMDISHRICLETYMAVRILCVVKKFPQVRFCHEIMLKKKFGKLNCILISIWLQGIRAV